MYTSSPLNPPPHIPRGKKKKCKPKFAVFLIHPVQGLSTSCHYFAEASMFYEMLMYVETLGSAGKELIFIDEDSTSVLYK